MFVYWCPSVIDRLTKHRDNLQQFASFEFFISGSPRLAIDQGRWSRFNIQLFLPIFRTQTKFITLNYYESGGNGLTDYRTYAVASFRFYYNEHRCERLYICVISVFYMFFIKPCHPPLREGSKEN